MERENFLSFLALDYLIQWKWKTNLTLPGIFFFLVTQLFRKEVKVVRK